MSGSYLLAIGARMTLYEAPGLPTSLVASAPASFIVRDHDMDCCHHQRATDCAAARPALRQTGHGGMVRFVEVDGMAMRVAVPCSRRSVHEWLRE
ncbi:MAG: hypothetical protein PVSMB4_20220 [Ktedonobacterales bacterium]